MQPPTSLVRTATVDQIASDAFTSPLSPNSDAAAASPVTSLPRQRITTARPSSAFPSSTTATRGQPLPHSPATGMTTIAAPAHHHDRLYHRAEEYQARRVQLQQTAQAQAAADAVKATKVNELSKRLLERPRSASVATRPALHERRPEASQVSLSARKAAQELAGCTFKPAITQKAQKLVRPQSATPAGTRGGGGSSSNGVFVKLFDDGSRLEEKRAAKRCALEEAALQGSTFKPAVDPYSAQLAQKRSAAAAGGGGSTAAARLYAEAQQTAARLAAKRAALAAQKQASCTFAPQVDARSRQLVQASFAGSGSNVYCRLHDEARQFAVAKAQAMEAAVAAQRAEEAKFGQPDISARSRRIAEAARSVMAHLADVASRYASSSGGGTVEATAEATGEKAVELEGGEPAAADQLGEGGDVSGNDSGDVISAPPALRLLLPSSPSSVFARLYQEATSEAALTSLKAEISQALEMAECTFRPDITTAQQAAVSAGHGGKVNRVSRSGGSSVTAGAGGIRLPSRAQLAGIGGAGPTTATTTGIGGRSVTSAHSHGRLSGGSFGGEALISGPLPSLSSHSVGGYYSGTVSGGGRPSIGGKLFGAGGGGGGGPETPVSRASGAVSASASASVSGSVRPWSVGGRSFFNGSASASTNGYYSGGRRGAAAAATTTSRASNTNHSTPYAASHDVWSSLSAERKDVAKLEAIRLRLEAAQRAPVPNQGVYTFAAVKSGRARPASAGPALNSIGGGGGGGGTGRPTSAFSAAGGGGKGGAAAACGSSGGSISGRHSVTSVGSNGPGTRRGASAGPGVLMSSSSAARSVKASDVWTSVVSQVQGEIAAGASPEALIRRAQSARSSTSHGGSVRSAVSVNKQSAANATATTTTAATAKPGPLRRLSVDESAVVSPSPSIHERLYRGGAMVTVTKSTGKGTGKGGATAAVKAVPAAAEVVGGGSDQQPQQQQQQEQQELQRMSTASASSTEERRAFH